jgi:hypothetical protein
MTPPASAYQHLSPVPQRCGPERSDTRMGSLFTYWTGSGIVIFVHSGTGLTRCRTVEGLNCKRPISICRLFFKIDLLTDIAALCLTDFIDWRYIHSLVGIFDPVCELLPPWTKELYLCTVAPLSSL